VLRVEKSQHTCTFTLLCGPTLSDPACSSGEAFPGGQSVGGSLPKSTRGRPKGIFKCATCSRKSRPCGVACPRRQGEEPGASAATPTALPLAQASTHPDASPTCTSSSPAELHSAGPSRSTPRPPAKRNLDRETPDWPGRRSAVSGKRRLRLSELVPEVRGTTVCCGSGTGLW